MDSFLPSEIARLVLGYLLEEGCLRTSDVFMNECSNLAEYTSAFRQGHEYPTKIGGKSLKTMLAEYGVLFYGINSSNDAVKKVWRRLQKAMCQLGLLQFGLSHSTPVASEQNKSCSASLSAPSASFVSASYTPNSRCLKSLITSNAPSAAQVADRTLGTEQGPRISTLDSSKRQSSFVVTSGSNNLPVQDNEIIQSNVNVKMEQASTSRQHEMIVDSNNIVAINSLNDNNPVRCSLPEANCSDTDMTPVKLSRNHASALSLKFDLVARDTRSPKRKSHAPRRRSYEDKFKESQLLNGVISSSHFAERLAETINRAVSKKPERGSSGLNGASEARNTGGLTTVMHGETALCSADFATTSTSSASAESALPADLAHDDDLNQIFQGLMTEEEITDIVNMARNDPHFESMFDMIIEGNKLNSDRNTNDGREVASLCSDASTSTSTFCSAKAVVSSQEFVPIEPDTSKPCRTQHSHIKRNNSKPLSVVREELTTLRRNTRANTSKSASSKTVADVPSASNSPGLVIATSTGSHVEMNDTSAEVRRMVYVRPVNSVEEAVGPVTRIYHPPEGDREGYYELVEELLSRPCSPSETVTSSAAALDNSAASTISVCNSNNSSTTLGHSQVSNVNVSQQSCDNAANSNTAIDGCKRQLFGNKKSPAKKIAVKKHKVASKAASKIIKPPTTGKKLEDLIDGVAKGEFESVPVSNNSFSSQLCISVNNSYSMMPLFVSSAQHANVLHLAPELWPTSTGKLMTSPLELRKIAELSGLISPCKQDAEQGQLALPSSQTVPASDLTANHSVATTATTIENSVNAIDSKNTTNSVTMHSDQPKLSNVSSEGNADQRTLRSAKSNSSTSSKKSQLSLANRSLTSSAKSTKCKAKTSRINRLRSDVSNKNSQTHGAFKKKAATQNSVEMKKLQPLLPKATLVKSDAMPIFTLDTSRLLPPDSFFALLEAVETVRSPLTPEVHDGHVTAMSASQSKTQRAHNRTRLPSSSEKLEKFNNTVQHVKVAVSCNDALFRANATTAVNKVLFGVETGMKATSKSAATTEFNTSTDNARWKSITSTTTATNGYSRLPFDALSEEDSVATALVCLASSLAMSSSSEDATRASNGVASNTQPASTSTGPLFVVTDKLLCYEDFVLSPEIADTLPVGQSTIAQDSRRKDIVLPTDCAVTDLQFAPAVNFDLSLDVLLRTSNGCSQPASTVSDVMNTRQLTATNALSSVSGLGTGNVPSGAAEKEKTLKRQAEDAISPTQQNKLRRLEGIIKKIDIETFLKNSH